MTRHPARAACAAAFAAVLIAGCGGDSGGTKTTVRTVPASQPTRAVVTGDPPVDQVIGAALASDEIELAGLVGYQRIACKKDSAERPGDPPKCREAESDGSLVEVLPVSGCDSAWVRPEQVPDSFRFDLPEGKPAMFAVVKSKVAPGTFGDGFGADLAVVFSTGKHDDGLAMGVALHLRNGRVVWIEADCRNLLELIARERVDAFIVDPNGTVTPSTPTLAASPAAALASATPPAP